MYTVNFFVVLPFIQAFVCVTAMLSCERFTGFVDIFAYKFDIAIFFVPLGLIHIIKRLIVSPIRRESSLLSDVRHVHFFGHSIDTIAGFQNGISNHSYLFEVLTECNKNIFICDICHHIWKMNS